MSEIINKPQPPVVRSGCKAPPPFRRIPGGAGKPGTKKGIPVRISLTLMPDKIICCSTLLRLSRRSTTWSNRTSRHSRIWTSHMPRHRTSRRSRHKPKLRSQRRQPRPGQPSCSNYRSSLPLQRQPLRQQRKRSFHSVKGLIISYSVTSQRYIFARILQIKNFNIFKVFACFRQAGTAAACRLCQAQKTKKGIQLFSSKGLPWRTPRS